MASYTYQSKCLFYLLSLLSLFLLFISTLIAITRSIDQSNTYDDENQNINSQDESLRTQFRSLLSSSSATTTTTQLFDVWDYRDGLPSEDLYHIAKYLGNGKDFSNFVQLPLPGMNYVATRWLLTTNDTIAQIILNDQTATMKDLINDYDDDSISLINFYLPFLTVPQKQWSTEQMYFWNQLVKIHRHAPMTRYLVLDTEKCEFNMYSGYGDCRRVWKIVYPVYDHNPYHHPPLGIFQYVFSGYAEAIDFTHCCREGMFTNPHAIFDWWRFSSLDNLIGLDKICQKFGASIERFKLNYNRLGPVIDFDHPILKQCNITSYQVEYNKIQSISNLEQISEMSSLKSLMLAGNRLTSFNFSIIASSRSNLESISLDKNNIRGTFDLSFVKNTKLKYIHLNNNEINSIENLNVIKHSNLSGLYFDNNKITVIDLKDLIDSNLTQLSLGGNQIQSIENFNVKTLKVTNLNWLKISRNEQVFQRCKEIEKQNPQNKNNEKIRLWC